MKRPRGFLCFGRAVAPQETLTSHDALDSSAATTPERLRMNFAQNVDLLRLKDAWEIALRIGQQQVRARARVCARVSVCV